jgi:CRISPR-associated endonuclease/helicase Cas3
MSGEMQFMGHSPSSENPEWQTLENHVSGVTERTTHHVRYMAVPGLTVYARLTGLLHDLGKYRMNFQQHRLGWNPVAGQPQKYAEKAVPHSDAGAKFMQGLLDMDHEMASELPFVIANHHGRLRDIDALSTRLNESEMQEVEALVDLAVLDTPELAELLQSELPTLPLEGTERAFLIRLLLSALVDADRLDTEEHGSPGKVEVRGKELGTPLVSRLSDEAADEKLEMGLLLARLERAQAELAAKDVEHPQPINALRREMYSAAVAQAEQSPGFFRLTMPTGGGKTLTSLAFALKHAQTHGLRRVIYGVPFTTIIDQTAKTFRELLEKGGEFKVLEHHSNLEVKEPSEGQERQTTAPDLATENWDAPIIVTTTVRLFQETLFGTRTAQLRRLHNVSGSVIVLDEAQSLPAPLLRPTLDALSFLVKYAGCSVVLCTATQPALDERMGFPALGNIRDLVPNAARYFDELKRVEYEFRIATPTPWSDLAAELNTHEQVLCIVNTRQHAHDLFALLEGSDGNFHLSTNMCPVHRKRELATIRQRLKDGLPCRVVSTQLIEAGVDVDFPRVYRAMGPLEAIVQAAGRCNREGRLDAGQVVVFRPEDHKLPKGDYEVRESLARTALNENADLHDPEVFTPYFQKLYGQINLAPKVKIYSGELEFQKAHAELYFEQVAAAYQMIDGEQVPVIIRGFNPAKVDVLLATIRDARYKGQARDAWRELQGYTISLYPHQVKKLAQWLVGVPELEERARRLGVEAPLIQQWPSTAQYDDKLGVVMAFDDDVYTRL